MSSEHARGTARTALCALVLLVRSAAAVTLTLDGPAAPVAVPDGDDFATRQLADPWDFDKPRDFLYENHLGGVDVTGGVWRGTATSAGFGIFPLFQGFPAALTALHRDMPAFGVDVPIDAARYTRLTYRLDVGMRSAWAIAYSRNAQLPVPCDQYPIPTCNPESGALAEFDGWRLPGRFVRHAGWTIYDLDLTSRGAFFGAFGVPWAGAVTGLQIQPSGDAPAGTTLAVDWIRLTDPTTSPAVAITWHTTDAPADAVVDVLVDASASGPCTGEVLARGVPNTGSWTLRTAVLPPGTWRVRLELQQQDVSQEFMHLLAASACSAPITIGQAPAVRVLAPSPWTGADYAAAAGNPWDMSGPEDVANLDEPFEDRWFTDPVFADGVFRATAQAPGLRDVWSDATLIMPGPERTPIDTGRYRWLTVRMWNQTSNFSAISEFLTRGGGLRPIFYDAGLTVDGTDGRAALLYEDWHDYAIDLADPNLPDPEDTGVPNVGWTAIPAASVFRVDPTEVQITSEFAFDEIAVRAEDCTDGPYTVRWDARDPDSAALTVDLWAEPEGGGARVRLAGPIAATAGTGEAAVDLAPLGPGRWHVVAVAADEATASSGRSQAPVVVPCAVPGPPPSLVPRAGSWTTSADGATAVADRRGAAVATWEGLGAEPTAAARVQPRSKRAKVLLVFDWKDGTHYRMVEIEGRTGRVVTWDQDGRRRRRLSKARLGREQRASPLALGLRTTGGATVATVNGVAVTSTPSTGGALGIGVAKRGSAAFTQLRAR